MKTIRSNLWLLDQRGDIDVFPACYADTKAVRVVPRHGAGINMTLTVAEDLICQLQVAIQKQKEAPPST